MHPNMGKTSFLSDRIARWRRDERGATAIEFAFVAPVLFFVLLSLIELGMIGMMISGLDNAVINASRMIRTGRADAAGTANEFEDQICADMGGAAACRDRLTISVQRFTSFGDANAIIQSQPDDQFEKGGPGDIMVIKANYKWPLMSPFLATAYPHDAPFEVTLASRIAFKNEPYE
jgi:Flp pilus assembly protein TadG